MVWYAGERRLLVLMLVAVIRREMKMRIACSIWMLRRAGGSTLSQLDGKFADAIPINVLMCLPPPLIVRRNSALC